MVRSNGFYVFAGQSMLVLAGDICRYLEIKLGKMEVTQFNNGAPHIKVQQNVRGSDVYVIQSIAASPPSEDGTVTGRSLNDNFMELLAIIDALRRSSAGHITAVLTHNGYDRQDRRGAARAPITAKLAAKMLETAGIGSLITTELHAGQIEGFYDCGVDNLHCSGLLIPALNKLGLKKVTVVTPDAGGTDRARAYASKITEAYLALIAKMRFRPGEAHVAFFAGDVENRDAAIVDDIIDTAGSLTKAAQELKKKGARRVVAAAIHPVFSDDNDGVPAVEKIMACNELEHVIVVETTPLTQAVRDCPKITVISPAELFAAAIKCHYTGGSMSSLGSS